MIFSLKNFAKILQKILPEKFIRIDAVLNMIKIRRWSA